jgi:hypothetical protein
MMRWTRGRRGSWSSPGGSIRRWGPSSPLGRCARSDEDRHGEGKPNRRGKQWWAMSVLSAGSFLVSTRFLPTKDHSRKDGTEHRVIFLATSPLDVLGRGDLGYPLVAGPLQFSARSSSDQGESDPQADPQTSQDHSRGEQGQLLARRC